MSTVRFQLLCLAVASFLSTNGFGQDIFKKYAADPANHSVEAIWKKKTTFYLAKKKSERNVDPQNVVRKLDENWVIIKLSDSTSFNQARNNYLALKPANSRWKYAQSILSIIQSGNVERIRKVRVSVISTEQSQLVSLLPYIEKIYADYYTVDVFISNTSALELIAADDNVTAITLTGGMPHTEQAVKRLDFGTNNIDLARDHWPAITGKNTVVSIKERLFDTTDIDFKNRFFLTEVASGIIDNHASIIGSMIGGSGNSYYTSKGIAPKTTLTNADFDNLMPEPMSYYLQNGIDVQNHSYGVGIENEYAADAAAYDLTTWQDTGLLHVFSAGNSGTSASTSGNYSGISNFANLTGSFKMSKNSLAIGGTDSFYQTENLSSKGPADDGRIKPELVAFGTDGTSGAAALVSGAALLLKQQLFAEDSIKASAALLKALLVAGANDIGTEGPDYASGFGSLNAFQSMRIVSKKQYLTASLAQEEFKQIKITIPPNTARVSITLAWTDTPAMVLAEKALVNDIDLELIHEPDGSTTKPWVLSRFANADSLQLAAVRGIDSVNNIENISLLNPSAGEYNIHVAAITVVTGRQAYAVAWSIAAKDSIILSYPSKNSTVWADTLLTIRWENINADDTATLEYKYTTAPDWHLITASLPLQQRWFQWQAPDTIASVQVRITKGVQTATSDSFIISKPLDMQVGYNCDDSVYLYWPKQTVDKYRIYNLGDTLMEPVAETTDTFFRPSKTLLTTNYVAVSPILLNRETARSMAIEYSQQGVGCYIDNFLADIIADSVRLTLSIGTAYNIESITWEKVSNGNFYDLAVIKPQNLARHIYTDKALQTGGNTYRVKVLLKNGQSIYSQTETVYYTGKKYYIAFPNPVRHGEPLFVVNNYYDGDLLMNVYDMTGRLIKKASLSAAFNTVTIDNLPAGIYLLLMNDGSKKLGLEKLIIE